MPRTRTRKPRTTEAPTKAAQILNDVPAPEPAAHTQNLDDPALYINRELSLLDFQERVLEEAEDASNPLLERVKFLSILSSNLDEFFMVRVAGLLKQTAGGRPEVAIDGQTAVEQIRLIRQRVKGLAEKAHRLLRSELLPLLAREGIRILDSASLSKGQSDALDSYFLQNVFPVLTPLAFDPGRPFPHISNRSLNLAVVVREKQGTEHFARVKVPDTLPQLVPIRPPGWDPAEPVHEFVWLEQLVTANLRLLFPGLEIAESYPFRLTRDAEVAIQELESDDLLETMEEAVRQRRFTEAVRLQVDARMPDNILEILTSNIEIDPEDVYRISGPLGLSRLMELCAINRPDLKDRPFVSYTPPQFGPDCNEDIFSIIRSENILLHHPFDSFQPVVEFLRQAARDPQVLAIKMTLYRVGRNSPIVAALLDAAEEGKQVAVLVELKARFDEESNIEWARKLEDAGVHVVYGLVGVKVHSKIALVVRQEGETIHRYLHLGTGNYNPATARLYTDFGFFSCDEQLGADATYFFNALTGYSGQHEPHRLLVAPVNLQKALENLILSEIELHKQGKKGHLIFKMNALEDPRMIRLLYQASQAGVQVDLLVRGLCCLRPGVEGVSDNIRVTSIVGRFLEHSRVYYFHNGGSEQIYLGSADLMRRNLRHRVEILFPIDKPELLERMKKILEIYMADEAAARRLQSDGTYVRLARGAEAEMKLSSQEWLLHHQGEI